MRRSLLFLVLLLAVPFSLLAQHSGGSSGSSGGGGGSHSSGSSGGGGGGSSHSSGGSGTSGSGSSTRSSSAGNSHAGGGSSGAAHSSSTTRGESRMQPSRQGIEDPKRPTRQPVLTITKEPKPGHRLLGLLSPRAVQKPPCRGRNCPVSCAAGFVATSAGTCVARAGNTTVCNQYDALGNCYQTSQFVKCSGPSLGVLRNQELEVERLGLARESTCAQAPTSGACADLTSWYNQALLRLQELRAQAGPCI